MGRGDHRTGSAHSKILWPFRPCSFHASYCARYTFIDQVSGSLNVPLSFHGRATLSTLPRTVNSRISVPMPTPRSAPYNPPRGSPIRNPHSNSPGRFRASCSQWSDLTATIFAPPSPRLHSRCRGGQLPRPLCTHVVPLLLRAHTASASGSPSPHAAGRHLAAQTGGLAHHGTSLLRQGACS